MLIHHSRIFAGLLIVFLFSITAATFYPVQNNLLLYLVISFLVITILFWPHKAIRYTSLVLLAVTLAFFRSGQIIPKNSPDWISYYIGKNVKMKVIIIEEPKITGKFQQIIAKPVENNVMGNLQISINQFPPYHFGDTLLVSGKISELKKDSEQYRGYFKAQNIYGFMQFPEVKKIGHPKMNFWDDVYFIIRKPLVELRLKYEDIIAKILPEPQAGLLSGILLGSRADISTELKSQLSATGTTHIIALSGFNITIIASIFVFLTKGFSRRLSFWLPLFGIIFFVLMTGLSASVVRAAIMGSMLLLAHFLGRQTDAPVAILFACTLMVFVSPMILVYDVGFHLSVTAMCGILFLAPKIEKYFAFMGKKFGTIMAQTVSAVVLAWPVTSYFFGSVSFVAPLANLLILPFISPFTVAALVIVTTGLFSIWLSGKLSIILWLVLSYFIKVIELLAGTSFAATSYKISSLWLLAGYYLIVFDIIIFIRKPRRKVGIPTSLKNSINEMSGKRKIVR